MIKSVLAFTIMRILAFAMELVLADHDQVELDVRVKYGFAHESSQAKIPVDSTARILAADQYERRAKNQAAGEEVQKRWVYLQ